MELSYIELDLIKHVSKYLYLDIEELSIDSDLFYLCINDYMEFAEIIMSIEKTFEICLEDYDLEDIKTLKQITEIIKEKKKLEF